MPPYLYSIDYGDSQYFIAHFVYDSNGIYHDPTLGHIPDGIPIVFNTLWGTVTPSSSTTFNGEVDGTYFALGESPVPTTTVIFAILNDYPLAYAYSVSITINIPPNGTNNVNNSPSPNMNTNTVNAGSKKNIVNKTVRMQNTGIPVAGIVLALLMVLGGFINTNKKQ